MKIMASSPITSWQIDRETVETVTNFIFLAPKSLQMVTADTKLRKPMTNLDSMLKSGDFTLSTQVYVVKSIVFPVVMYGCESWTINKTEHWRRCLWTMLLEKRPLDCKEIKPVNHKGKQSWIFIGWTDAEAEAPILWLADAKSLLSGKDPEAGEDWTQEEKGTTEDEMVEWHHQLDGHEFEQAPGVVDGQGSLACCSPWAAKSRTRLSDWTDWTVDFNSGWKRHSRNKKIHRARFL